MGESAQAQLELPFVAHPTALASDVVVLEGRVINYRLVRRRGRRRVSISIDERGLRVGAPWRASIREIESVLREHTRWVLRKLEEWQARRMPPPRWLDGEVLMLRGESIVLRVAHGLRTVHLEAGCLHVAAPQQHIQRDVIAWLRECALTDFRMRVGHFQPLLGVKEPRILLSNARTRWGSCHVNGSVLLNWRLIQMPPRLIDYVVVHELAHLREMNHSPRFWSIVGGAIPDYKARRAEIRRESHRYLRV